MHLVYPSNFAQPLCVISLGIAVMPRRNSEYNGQAKFQGKQGVLLSIVLDFFSI